MKYRILLPNWKSSKSYTKQQIQKAKASKKIPASARIVAAEPDTVAELPHVEPTLVAESAKQDSSSTVVKWGAVVAAVVLLVAVAWSMFGGSSDSTREADQYEQPRKFSAANPVEQDTADQADAVTTEWVEKLSGKPPKLLFTGDRFATFEIAKEIRAGVSLRNGKPSQVILIDRQRSPNTQATCVEFLLPLMQQSEPSLDHSAALRKWSIAENMFRRIHIGRMPADVEYFQQYLHADNEDSLCGVLSWVDPSASQKRVNLRFRQLSDNPDLGMLLWKRSGYKQPLATRIENLLRRISPDIEITGADVDVMGTTVSLNHNARPFYVVVGLDPTGINRVVAGTNNVKTPDAAYENDGLKLLTAIASFIDGASAARQLAQMPYGSDLDTTEFNGSTRLLSFESGTSYSASLYKK